MDALAARSAPPRAQLGVAQQLDQRRGQPRGVARRHESSGLTVEDTFRNAADRRGHDRQAAGHRFQNCQGQRVFQRGQRENIGGGQNLVNVHSRSGQRQPVGDLQPFGFRHHLARVLAPRISDTQHVHVADRRHDRGQGAHQIQHAFPRNHVTHDAHNENVRVNRQLLAHALADGGTDAMIARVVDEVVDHFDTTVPHQIVAPMKAPRGLGCGHDIVVQHPMRLHMAAIGGRHTGNAIQMPQQDPKQVGTAHVRLDHVDLPLAGQLTHRSQIVQRPTSHLAGNHLDVRRQPIAR